jgi:hypothetical protein
VHRFEQVVAVGVFGDRCPRRERDWAQRFEFPHQGFAALVERRSVDLAIYGK